MWFFRSANSALLAGPRAVQSIAGLLSQFAVYAIGQNTSAPNLSFSVHLKVEAGAPDFVNPVWPTSML
jgi:hypothetical protein